MIEVTATSRDGRATEIGVFPQPRVAARVIAELERDGAWRRVDARPVAPQARILPFRLPRH